MPIQIEDRHLDEYQFLHSPSYLLFVQQALSKPNALLPARSVGRVTLDLLKPTLKHHSIELTLSRESDSPIAQFSFDRTDKTPSTTAARGRVFGQESMGPVPQFELTDHSPYRLFETLESTSGETFSQLPYLTWGDSIDYLVRSRYRCLSALGMSREAVLKSGVGFVASRFDLFTGPVDTLYQNTPTVRVQSQILSILRNQSHYLVGFKLTHPDAPQGAPAIVQGHMVFVCIDLKTGKPMDPPDDIWFYVKKPLSGGS